MQHLRHAHLALCMLLLVSCQSAMTPRSASPADVIAYVDRAAELIARDPEKACDTLRTRQWFSGDWYLFVLADDGRTVCHAARPEMAGRPAEELVDAAGRKFGLEFLQVARQGGGWVDYLWPRPGAAVATPKRSYVRSVTAADGRVFIVGSGGYEMK